MVISQDNKILLVEGHTRGWEFPGGYVNSKESIKDAAIREVKEESGIDIRLINILGFEHDIKRAKMVVVLKGLEAGGVLKISEESQNIGFFYYDEALRKIKLKNFKDRLVRCFNEKEPPFFIEH